MTVEPFRFRRGSAPLLVSMPHAGTYIPEAIAARMTETALRTPDTDWHIDRLYDFLDEIGASVLTATHSRYVVDLNRPPDDASLYPGQTSTGLCPAATFSGEPLYRDGSAPSADEIDERRERYWRPYHDQLSAELKRLRDDHGFVLLWEAHSIASRVPRLFEGELPQLNIGTAGGKSAVTGLGEALLEHAQASRYSVVLNGRFTGGHITRHYGQPSDGTSAVQLELTQACYMDEAYPFAFREEKANALRPVLRGLVTMALRVCSDAAGKRRA